MNGAELKEFLLRPVGRDLFANRIVIALNKINIHFVGQLLFLTQPECMRVSLSYTSLDEIRKGLEPKGLILGMMSGSNEEIKSGLRGEDLSKKEIRANLEQWLDDPATNVALYGRLEPSNDVFVRGWVKHFLPKALKKDALKENVLTDLSNDPGLKKAFLQAALKDPQGSKAVVDILLGASQPAALIPSLTPEATETITDAVGKAIQLKLKL